MSHPVYTTPAIVCATRNVGEASRYYWLLTPDFGLLLARAQGARERRSKLNGHLSLLAHTNISLVRGRVDWHLVGAEASGRYGALWDDRPTRALGARVAALLGRLLPEAAPDPLLFELLDQEFADLALASPGAADLRQREIFLVWRLLHQLGYIPGPVPLGRAAERYLILDINRALTHSHL